MTRRTAKPRMALDPIAVTIAYGTAIAAFVLQV